jgi:hypothetical protein
VASPIISACGAVVKSSMAVEARRSFRISGPFAFLIETTKRKNNGANGQ